MVDLSLTLWLNLVTFSTRVQDLKSAICILDVMTYKRLSKPAYVDVNEL